MKEGANLAPNWYFRLFFDFEGNRVKRNKYFFSMLEKKTGRPDFLSFSKFPGLYLFIFAYNIQKMNSKDIS